MSTIEEQIKSLIPQMTEQVAQQIRQRAFEALQYEMVNQVTAAVRVYVAESVLPSVQKELEQHNEEIRGAVLAALKTVAAKSGEALVEHAAKKLTEYGSDKLLANMFGPLLRGY